MTFWCATNFCIRNSKYLVWHSPMVCRLFFVLNAANLSEENGKLARTTCASLNNTTMKEALKNVFWCIVAGTEKCSCAKEEVEMINFSHHKDVNEKKSYGRKHEGISPVNKLD